MYLSTYIYDSASDLVTDFKPLSSNADMITYEFDGATYILGAGNFEATLLVLKVSGVATIEGYAWIRARIDWQGRVS